MASILYAKRVRSEQCSVDSYSTGGMLDLRFLDHKGQETRVIVADDVTLSQLEQTIKEIREERYRLLTKRWK